MRSIQLVLLSSTLYFTAKAFSINRADLKQSTEEVSPEPNRPSGGSQQLDKSIKEYSKNRATELNRYTDSLFKAIASSFLRRQEDTTSKAKLLRSLKGEIEDASSIDIILQDLLSVKPRKPSHSLIKASSDNYKMWKDREVDVIYEDA
ncbi:uncharacterized protein [Watersipora subatra]|uniref:uncharacterized protein n=1 Tax=Watersipora subatra TaxID=2589382 RepID=UPI00355BB53B